MLINGIFGKVKVLPDLQLFFALFLLSALIIILDISHLLAWPKTALSFISTPIQFGLYDSSRQFGKQFSFISAIRYSVQENAALKQQLADILSENAGLRTQLAETQAKIDQQSAIDPRTYKLLAARPIGIDRYLKIDKGSQDGIKNNQAVIFKDNYLGKIVWVDEKTSQVQLSTDPDSKIAAFSLNKSGKAKGVLIGQFRTDMVFDKVLHEESMSVGDLVYSEGTEGFLPRGLILGTVSEVDPQPNQVFKTAKVKSVFDTSDLELVFVIVE